MFNTLIYILIATFINSSIALIGAFGLLLKEKTLKDIIFYFVAFSAGALFAGALFHLTTESLEFFSTNTVFVLVIIGFLIFFILERVLQWHHCHKIGRCNVHKPIGILILFGDSVHNFIDGIIIGASFLINSYFGIVTTLIIILHEIPQELGDFAILLFSGFNKKKALFYNFLSQITCIVGGILIFFIRSDSFSKYLLPFSAGGFLYISTSDLIPELHREKNLKKSFITFIILLTGIGFIIAIKSLTHH